MNGMPVKINSKLIEEIRRKLKYSQKELGELIGLKLRSYFYNIERGTMKPKHIKLLIQVLNSKTEELKSELKEITENDILR